MKIKLPINGNPSHQAPIQLGSPSSIVTFWPGMTYIFKQKVPNAYPNVGPTNLKVYVMESIMGEFSWLVLSSKYATPKE